MDDYLEGHPRYKQVRKDYCWSVSVYGGLFDEKLCGNGPSTLLTCPVVQIRFLNRGAYGFVILALDNQTGEQVALKFIKRGPQHITKYVDREVSCSAFSPDTQAPYFRRGIAFSCKA